jgi:hypothetical protein
MKKKIIIIIGLTLILAIGGAAVYVLTNLNAIVEAAIEKYGSQATKTTVRVSSVQITLGSGEGEVKGLKVANPSGFPSPSIMTLDDISVRIAAKSVTSTPIVIENILISGPEVFCEMKEDGTANLDVLKKNLATLAPQEQKEKGAKEKEIRLRVRKLVFEKGKVNVRIAQLVDKPYIVELPRLELHDIGSHGGATPAEIVRIMATALAEESAKAVAKTQGKRLLRKGTERLLNKYLNK